MTTILAIDPGQSGGIAILPGQGMPAAYPMPDTEGDIVSDLRSFKEAADREGWHMVAYLEDQTFCAGIAVSAPAMGKFGRNFGFILGVLMALGVRVELVRPQAWIKGLGLGKREKGQSKTEWKNKLKSEAQRLYPQCKVTLATADSLLLLEYARRKPTTQTEAQ